MCTQLARNLAKASRSLAWGETQVFEAVWEPLEMMVAGAIWWWWSMVSEIVVEEDR